MQGNYAYRCGPGSRNRYTDAYVCFIYIQYETIERGYYYCFYLFFLSLSLSSSLPSIHGILCPSCPAGRLREGLRRCCFPFVSSAAKKSFSDDTPFSSSPLISRRFSPFVGSSLPINYTNIVFVVSAASDNETRTLNVSSLLISSYTAERFFPTNFSENHCFEKYLQKNERKCVVLYHKTLKPGTRANVQWQHSYIENASLKL